VELGEGGVSLASSAFVKRREVLGRRIGEEGRTKFELSEIGNCGGAFEFGMDFVFCVEGLAKNMYRGGC